MHEWLLIIDKLVLSIRAEGGKHICGFLWVCQYHIHRAAELWDSVLHKETKKGSIATDPFGKLPFPQFICGFSPTHGVFRRGGWMPRGTSRIFLKSKSLTTGLIPSCIMRVVIHLLFSHLNLTLHSFPDTQHMCEEWRSLHSSGHAARVKYLETHSETPAVQTREEKKKSPEL